MGISGLKKFCDNMRLFSVVDRNFFKGKTIAIDTNAILGRLRSVSNDTLFCFKNYKEAIDGLGLDPIWVFDGNLYKRTQERILYKSVKALLPADKIVLGAGEGEFHCVELQKQGRVELIGSSDSDIFAFGGTNLCFDLVKGGQTLKKTLLFKMYYLDTILKFLKLDMDEFIDVCIFAGTDVNFGLKGVGIVKGAKMLKTMGRPEEYCSTKDYQNGDYFLRKHLDNLINLDDMDIVMEERAKIKNGVYASKEKKERRKKEKERTRQNERRAIQEKRREKRLARRKITDHSLME